MPDEAPLEGSAAEEDDAFPMANLFPRDTGLPMTVWIGERAGARHDVQVKVSQVHGQRIMHDEMAVVAVRPEPSLVHGRLAPRDLALVARWIGLNRDVIIDHWDGRASTVDLVRRLQPLPA